MPALHATPKRRRRPLWVALLLVFLLSRLVYSLAGVRFELSWLGEAWQFLDPVLLVNDLGRSLWYLHMQPPLFNLFLGVTLKTLGPLSVAGFAATFLLLSFAAFSSSVHLLRWFGLPAAGALAVSALYYLGPTAVLYENWLFYTWPVAVLLLLAAVVLRRYLESPSLHRALLFFTLLASLCLIRSVFHLAWLVAAVVALAAIRPRRARTALAAALLPVLLVTAVYAKNGAVFGQFGVSSWLWMSLGKTAAIKTTDREGRAWVQGGVLSPVAAIYPFSAPENYAPYVGVPPVTGVPALDAPRKSTGTTNYNHSIYLRVTERYRDDVLLVLRRSPETYLGVVAAAAVRSLRSPLGYFALGDNLERLTLLRRTWERAFYLCLPEPPPVAGNRPWWSGVSVTVALAVAVTLAAGLAHLLRTARRRRWTDREAVFLFLALNAGYVFLLGLLLEMGENERFRVMVEPLLLVATAVVVHRGWRRWRRRAGGTAEVAP